MVTYTIKRIEQDWTKPRRAKEVELGEVLIKITHLDESIEFIPLLSIESILLGDDQPWTKADVKENN